MAPDSLPDESSNSSPAPAATHSRFWWLVRGMEVRLRFFLAIGAVAGLFAGWPWLRMLWERTMSPHSHSHAGAVSGDSEFFCPMDPGVISAWPAICPICNMDLVPRKKTDAVLLPEGVVARMQFSPYRVQLAGIRTVPIESRELEYTWTFRGLWQSPSADLSGFSAESDSPPREFAPESKGHLDVIVGPEDAAFFRESRPATLQLGQEGDSDHSGNSIPAIATPISNTEPGGTRVRVSLKNGPSPARLKAGAIVAATVQVPAAAVLHHRGSAAPTKEGSNGILVVPASAVLNHGSDRIIYVETMPGMFDGIRVELGRRSGDVYPVLSGLQAGQRVAAMGSFLVDAESRLNPNIAVQYFGANAQTAGRGSPPTLPQRSKKAGGLSEEDKALAKSQKDCPVTRLPLGSMGEPVFVVVKDRKVFLCCKGCEKAVKTDPDKYLERLKESPAK